MEQHLQTIIKRSAESLAIDALRTYVLSGGAAPGEKLTEMALSERLGVSRATVRTALQRLSVEGLISQIPYTGWEVARLTAHDAWELWTLRSSLEGLAARLATERGGTQVKAEVREAMDRLEHACASPDRRAASEADFGLHKTIVKLAQHGRLIEQYRLIEQQTSLYIQSSNKLIPEPREIMEQHLPIVEAILAGRAAQAARLSEKHNEQEGTKLVAYLKSRSSTDGEP